MARGPGKSGGGARGGAPDWLSPREDVPVQQQQRGGDEKPRRRRKGDEDEDEPPSKGIRWGPIFFLIMMTLPAALPMLLDVVGKLQAMGVIDVPDPSAVFYPNKYRPCLVEYYADWAPEKLGGVDDALAKYEGKERQLFGKLHRKYGKKVNLANCK